MRQVPIISNGLVVKKPEIGSIIRRHGD
ncbi:BnaC01g42260D [Brassica napus]|uniref:BnaC01g42260D protein n=1 Tax=Brassica napus TaxID=3708 RepID=A0A078DHT6_BRANA|nr:BnaC01g42260D [Brassica napus]